MLRRASLAGAIGLIAAAAGTAAPLASTMAFSWPWPVAHNRDAAARGADFRGALGLCAPRPVAQPSLLIHNGPHRAGYNTAAALPSVIDGLRARGFELVTVSELPGSS